jgi:hypothetical protein
VDVFLQMRAAAIVCVTVESWLLVSPVTFESCRWEANMVAHVLARFSLINLNSCIWDDDPLSFIFSLLINDGSVFDNQ